MDIPLNSQWGPALWTILHSSAERWGSKSLHRLPHEETRIWSTLLQSLRYSLPCPQCKKHYQAYYTGHPLSVFTKEDIRGWIYQLHCEVNRRNGKPDGMTVEQCAEAYSAPFSFSHHSAIVTQHMRAALRKGWVTREDMFRTLRYMEEMKRFYDFF